MKPYSTKVKGEEYAGGKVCKNTRPTLALIDGNNWCIRAYFTSQKPDEGDIDLRTQAFVMISKFLSTYEVDALVFTFDGGREWRTKLIETGDWRTKSGKKGYKGTRTFHDDREYAVIKASIKQFAHDLPIRLGIPVLMLDTVEADDVIFTATKMLRGVNKLVVSTDEDLVLACLNPNTYWYSPLKGIVVSKHTYPDYNYGMPLKAYSTLKAIVGDTSDNIEGVAGIGEQTLFTWAKKSGVYPWKFFDWVDRFGTINQKKKYLIDPGFRKNFQLALKAIDLRLYEGQNYSELGLLSDLLAIKPLDRVEVKKFCKEINLDVKILSQMHRLISSIESNQRGLQRMGRIWKNL